jgi:hypothetical protein
MDPVQTRRISNSVFPPNAFPPYGGINPPKAPKDILWKTYVPANPPETGWYMVVSVTPGVEGRSISMTNYDKDKLDWGLKSIVTHYAKIEYPE